MSSKTIFDILQAQENGEKCSKIEENSNAADETEQDSYGIEQHYGKVEQIRMKPKKEEKIFIHQGKTPKEKYRRKIQEFEFIFTER